MANSENLIPRKELSTEEAKAMGRAGGIKSGEARRRKRKIREGLELVLSMPITLPKARATLESLGLGDELTNEMAMIVGIWKKAVAGDVSAFNSIRDTLGEKPVDVQEITTKNDPIEELVQSIEKIKNGDK